MTFDEIKFEIILCLKQYNKSKSVKERRVIREKINNLYTQREDLLSKQYVNSTPKH
jgi:hypothetical protein